MKTLSELVFDEMERRVKTWPHYLSPKETEESIQYRMDALAKAIVGFFCYSDGTLRDSPAKDNL